MGAHYSIKVKVRKVRNSHFEGDMYAQYEVTQLETMKLCDKVGFPSTLEKFVSLEVCMSTVYNSGKKATVKATDPPLQ